MQAILINHLEMAVMKGTRNILYRATVLSLVGALFASGAAQAEPAPYSKTLTFTLSTPNPAVPAARPRYYLPANTKYSNVQLQRAGTQVAVESLEIAHEGFRSASPPGKRVSR